MNEEEKEVIEELNEILKQWQQIINIENEEEREIEMSLYFEEMPFKDIQIALNLIDKLQEENKNLKEDISNIYFDCVNDIDYFKGDIIRDLRKIIGGNKWV